MPEQTTDHYLQLLVALAPLAVVLPGCTATDAAHVAVISAVLAELFVLYMSKAITWKNMPWWFAGSWLFFCFFVMPVFAATSRAFELGDQSVLGWMRETLSWGHWMVIALIMVTLLLWGLLRLRHLDQERAARYTKIQRDHNAQNQQGVMDKFIEEIYNGTNKPPPE